MTAEWWVYLVGYGYSIFVVEIVFHLTSINKLRKIKNYKNSKFDNVNITLGIVERFLYTTSWLLHKPQFIGLWLIIKELPYWQKAGKRNILALNGISLSYGIFGGIIINMFSNNQDREAITIAILLIIFTVLVSFSLKLPHKSTSEE